MTIQKLKEKYGTEFPILDLIIGYYQKQGISTAIETLEEFQEDLKNLE